MAKEAQLKLKAGAHYAQEKAHEGSDIATHKFNEVKDTVTK